MYNTIAGMLHKAKKKSYLIVLHCLPLIFENWKKVFTKVYRT